MKAIGTVLLGLAVAVGAGMLQPAGPAPPVGGRLAGAVLLGEAPLSEADLPNALSMADRLLVVTYLERRLSLDVHHSVPDGPDETERQRVALEIAATLETEGIVETARAIAATLGPAALQVTASDDPERGVSWAEGLVREPAHAEARPWLYAFLASRYRIQFERAGEDRGVLERLAKKYKTMLDRVRTAGTPLLVVLGNDLDNRASLLPGIARHPRQYLPDT